MGLVVVTVFTLSLGVVCSILPMTVYELRRKLKSIK